MQVKTLESLKLLDMTIKLSPPAEIYFLHQKRGKVVLLKNHLLQAELTADGFEFNTDGKVHPRIFADILGERKKVVAIPHFIERFLQTDPSHFLRERAEDHRLYEADRARFQESLRRGEYRAIKHLILRPS